MCIRDRPGYCRRTGWLRDSGSWPKVCMGGPGTRPRVAEADLVYLAAPSRTPERGSFCGQNLMRGPRARPRGPRSAREALGLERVADGEHRGPGIRGFELAAKVRAR
eukprot:9078092-Alexandrium_andersonii.AAC.1